MYEERKKVTLVVNFICFHICYSNGPLSTDHTRLHLSAITNVYNKNKKKRILLVLSTASKDLCRNAVLCCIDSASHLGHQTLGLH